MLKAVIFDFDGVITDSEILHFRAFNAILAEHGVKLTIKDYYKAYLGFTDVDCFKSLISQGLLKIEESQIPDLVRKKTVVFEELAKSEGRMIEGVRGFIGMLEANEIPMAICSGALLPEIAMVLDEAGLSRLFEVIVSAEQITKGKPDPQGFLLTLQKLNAARPDPILAKQCVVIEDSQWGLQAANHARMHTIAVTNSYDADQLTMAEKIVANLSELIIADLQQLCA